MSSAALQSNGRSASRTNMFIAATLVWGKHRNPAKVRNMSATGALVESPVVPAPGTRVLLVRGSFSADGSVVWADRNRCGLHLTTAIDVRSWLAPPANVEQQRVDQVVAIVKAGAVPLPVKRATGSHGSSQLLSSEQLTQDLALVSKLIEDLGDDLASDPATLMRHAAKLQNIDIAMQMLAALCTEMRAEEPGSGAHVPRLEDLRTSCGQALRN